MELRLIEWVGDQQHNTSGNGGTEDEVDESWLMFGSNVLIASNVENNHVGEGVM